MLNRGNFTLADARIIDNFTATHEPRNASGAIDDPMSWLVVVGVILAATLLACWRPARTACRVHPAELLRQD
ncbi:MAG TPA: hypothetical protein VGD06_15075 [Acidobacteriota bacterium]